METEVIVEIVTGETATIAEIETVTERMETTEVIEIATEKMVITAEREMGTIVEVVVVSDEEEIEIGHREEKEITVEGRVEPDHRNRLGRFLVSRIFRHSKANYLHSAFRGGQGYASNKSNGYAETN